MAKLGKGRSGFRDWVDKQPDPEWPLMPLTHITNGVVAEDIIRRKQINATKCDVFKRFLIYLFYGRPAYRIAGDNVIKLEAACPYCFIFKPELIREAESVFAFDTGAFASRMYNHVITDGMKVEDFSLDCIENRPNKMIAAIFSSVKAYFDGDTNYLKSTKVQSEAWEFHARAYLELLASPGRNEPDDRICSIEVIFGKAVSLSGNLKAIIVPHTLWDDRNKTPWLETLHKAGVVISPYTFVPGRHPEHYHALLEIVVRDIYTRWGVL